MALTITEKSDTLGTFRFVFVRLMEMLARWVPTSPELEVKTLLGRHIWTLAQHADAIGHRTVELRAKLHYERPPLSSYADVIQLVGATSSSGNRVAGFYDAVLPDLARRLEQYLENTDELLDAPTVEILRRILVDVARMQDDRRQFGLERSDVLPETEWVERMKAMLASCAEFVDRREAVTR
jgi:hypothetical protein